MITCPVLPAIANGGVTINPVGTPVVGSAVTYSCNQGYFLQGDMIRDCTGDGLSVSGTWTGTEPTCIGMIHNAYGIKHMHVETHGRKSIVLYLSRSCLNILYFVNTAITCSGLSTPSNGIITYTTDTTAPFDYLTTATYVCNTGYGLSGGNRVRNCVGSVAGPGEWSGTAPTCEGVYMCTLDIEYIVRYV